MLTESQIREVFAALREHHAPQPHEPDGRLAVLLISVAENFVLHQQRQTELLESLVQMAFDEQQARLSR